MIIRIIRVIATTVTKITNMTITNAPLRYSHTVPTITTTQARGPVLQIQTPVREFQVCGVCGAGEGWGWGGLRACVPVCIYYV